MNIVRAARHLVKVVFFVVTRRRYENHRIFLWKCILGQTAIIYSKFGEDWRIFHKVIALWNFMAKWRISWPRPSDIVHQKVMILITFHRQSLMNTHAKFQKDRSFIFLFSVRNPSMAKVKLPSIAVLFGMNVQQVSPNIEQTPPFSAKSMSTAILFWKAMSEVAFNCWCTASKPLCVKLPNLCTL